MPDLVTDWELPGAGSLTADELVSVLDPTTGG
jgi:hypothetical protein